MGFSQMPSILKTNEMTNCTVGACIFSDGVVNCLASDEKIIENFYTVVKMLQSNKALPNWAELGEIHLNIVTD